MSMNQRFSLALISVMLVLGIIISGCTSSGSPPATSNDAGSSAAANHGEFHSDFVDMAGTYVSVDDPASYIVLDPTGSVRIVTGSTQSDTSYYMEMGELKLADGTGIGPYPIQDNTLVFEAVNYKKQS
jgi:hypothetical protein